MFHQKPVKISKIYTISYAKWYEKSDDIRF